MPTHITEIGYVPLKFSPFWESDTKILANQILTWFEINSKSLPSLRGMPRPPQKGSNLFVLFHRPSNRAQMLKHVCHTRCCSVCLKICALLRINCVEFAQCSLVRGRSRSTSVAGSSFRLRSTKTRHVVRGAHDYPNDIHLAKPTLLGIQGSSGSKAYYTGTI